MKNFTLFISKNQLIIGLTLLLGLFRMEYAKSQEFLIREETFTITKEDSEPYFNNSFHWWSDMSEYPADWTTPYNYEYGKVYIRYEILEQPQLNGKYRKTAMQFNMWAKPLHSGPEKGSNHIQLNGPGSVAIDSSQLHPWWEKNGPFLFDNVNNIDRMGIVVWDGVSNCLPSTWEELLPLDNANNCLNPALAATFTELNGEWNPYHYQDYFFPMKVRVTVVAVALGHKFSGFEKYNAGSPAPFTIDYAAEKTNEIVSSSWETATNKSGPWVLATNSKSTLTPNANNYFRKTADPSNVRTLVVPARPAAPAVGINYTNETTNISIPATMEFSNALNMTPAITGTGVALNLIPGNNFYFRDKAKAQAFASSVQTLVVPARPVAPAVGIDYTNENTDAVIPATMEYANNIDFTSATPGTGSKLDLLPGEIKYFRNLATASAFKSEKQTLTVGPRPAAPTFAIDFINEQTDKVVSANDEYSSAANMAGASAGIGTKLALTPNSVIYFRAKATASLFKSNVQQLSVPVRPTAPVYAIDYVAETTLTNVSADDEYDTNSNMVAAIQGGNSKIPVLPGNTFYFRKKATPASFRSDNSLLTAASRPAAPVFTIDYSNVSTIENIPVTVTYADNSNFTSAMEGSGSKLTLNPSSSLYFKYKATNAAFSSEASVLTIPARPVTPSYGIDYIIEKTNAVVPATVEFSESSNFSGAAIGTGSQLALTPGKTLYFRVKATANKFASLPYTLAIPARAAAPSFGINYANETTNAVVDNTHEYSSSEAFVGSQVGVGGPVAVVPTVPMYFRKKSTNTSFYGSTQTLMVPARPSITAAITDTTYEKLVNLNITFPAAVTGFEASDITLTNAALKSLIGNYTIQIAPGNEGNVLVNIGANVVSGGNFKANQFKFYFKKSTGIRDAMKLKGVTMFPNPSNGSLNISTNDLSGDVTLEISSLQGKSLLVQTLSSNFESVDLTSLPKGIYLVRISNNGLSTVEKIILQ